MNKKLYKYKSLWLLSLVAAYLLFGFFYVPKLIDKHLKIQLQQQLGMQAELSAVKFNPITFNTELSDLKLTDNKQQAWYSSQTTGINFDPLNLLWGEWKFSDLKLIKPNITLLTDETGQIIIPALPEFTAAEDSGESIDFAIDNIQLIQGRMNLQAGNIKKDFALNIKSIEIRHDKFSLADEDTRFDIKITTENDESIALNGHYNHVQQQVQSKIELMNWQATTLNQVLPDNLYINNQSGKIQASGQIDWPLKQSPVINFSSIQIENLGSLWQNSVQLLGLTASIDAVKIDTETQQVSVGKFSSDQASWQMTWPMVEPAVLADAVETEPNQDEKPWQVKVQNIEIKQWPIELIDKQVSANLPIKIDALNVTSLNTGTEPIQMTGQINLGQHGNITLSSEQTLSPFKLQGEMTLEAIHLADLAPWISAETGLVITQGSLNSEQTINLDNDDYVINGNLSVADAIFQNQQGQDIADFGQLIIGATSIISKDKTITIDQITLDRANGNIIIDDNKNINIQNLKAGSDDEAQVEKNNGSTDEWLIKVGAINIKDTSTALIDQSVKPQVKTSISELNGQIKGLSSESLSKADVDIKGKFNQFSPLSIQGQINPLSSDAYTDLKVVIEDLDLLAFSPYSTSYVAFPINGGKLNLELEYSLNQHELRGENNLLFKQFKLGDKTPSPDALDVPLKLAVTLLSDMNGEMKINLPVSGNLTDPEFNYGGLVGKAIFKLITSIVASPFKILGALIPNPDPNLSDIQFAPGSADLLASEENKLKQIAEIMTKKSDLNLQLNPQINNAFDLTGLQLAMLLEQAPFTRFDPADNTVTEWLSAQLSPEEMVSHQLEDGRIDQAKIWQAMIDKQVVEPASFKALTEQRTLNIKNFLLESAGIAAEKIFIEQAQTTENNLAMIKIGVSR